MSSRIVLVAAIACAVGCGGRPAGERLSAPGGEGAAPEEAPAAGGAPEPADDAPAGDTPPPSMRAILDAHNRVRADHCAPPLVWSDQLGETAQAWADRLGSRCALEHSGGTIGENLSMATEGALDADGVVHQWYREKDLYRFPTGGFSMETGHFTQVVWVATRALGCGTATCRGLRIWVCNYDPPGNVRGQYQDNVLPTSCAAR